MRISWTIVLVSCVLFLSGCSGVPVTPPTQTAAGSVPGAALQGMVHGGQQPIVGAHVYLYAANTTGYGDASVSLLVNTGGTTEDTNGNYYYHDAIRGHLQHYRRLHLSQRGLAGVPVRGGRRSGIGTGANAAIGLMAALGTCGSLSSAPYAVINEVSTIATAYAFAGFATDATHVSSSSSALATATDVPNAFATVTNLESLGPGVALATTPGGQRGGTAKRDRHAGGHTGGMRQLVRAVVDTMQHVIQQRDERRHAADGNGDGGDQHRAQPRGERGDTLRIAAGESARSSRHWVRRRTT